MWWFGTTIEDQLDQVKANNEKMLPGKRINRLRELLGLPKLYRDPRGSKAARSAGPDTKGQVKF